MVLNRLFAGLAAAFSLAAPAAAQPPVWVVRDADSELVLFGSVHVLPPGLPWRSAALDAALRDADDLWFELPSGPDAEQEIARLAASRGMLAPDQSLFTLLPPADAARLIKVADAHGMDKASLSRLKPWLAEVALASAVYAKAGADSRFGVEAMLGGSVPAAVRREALETASQQIGFFDETPMAEQLASLAGSLRELEEDPDTFADLVRAWMAGDVGALDREALQPLRRASPGVFRRLVTERNERWVSTLDARLKGNGRTVVVVGVGHLVGAEGLPARFRALGYSVTGP